MTSQVRPGRQPLKGEHAQHDAEVLVYPGADLLKFVATAVKAPPGVIEDRIDQQRRGDGGQGECAHGRVDPQRAPHLA